jgi:hypothetical protein
MKESVTMADTDVLETGTDPDAEAERYVNGLLYAMDARITRALVAAGDVVVGPEDIDPTGTRFKIKMLVPVGTETGDGRSFEKNSLSFREFPLPLLWQPATQNGHDSSVVVGRIDSAELDDDGSIVNVRGVFDTSPHAREIVRLIRDKMIRGVSADLDLFTGEYEASEDDDPNPAVVGDQKMTIKRARLMGATIVPKPAFQEAVIELDLADVADDAEAEEISDGVYAGELPAGEEFALTASANLSLVAPLAPPREWFDNPQLVGPTRLTVDDDGRVYGHIASWHVDHIGLPRGTKPPRSPSEYAYFKTGVLRTEEGDDIRVGQITYVGGHAPLNATAAEAVRHYDDTNSAWADVNIGEDKYGIWAAGALRPGLEAHEVRAIRAAAPSGDWRPIRGRLELVAVCQVNVPGFPVVQARVASGHVTALVAAGTAPLLELHTNDQDPVVSRIARLEAAEQERLTARAHELTSRFRTLVPERDLDAEAAALKARFETLVTDEEAGQFRYYTPKRREEYAKKGIALKDGSYPIRTVADLKNAISAYGRAPKNKRKDVRRHIKKRARALGRSDLIPATFKEAAIEAEDLLAEKEELSARVAALRVRKWDERFHPRDDEGKFTHVLFKLSDLLNRSGGKDKKVKEEVLQEVRDAADASDRGDNDTAEELMRDAANRVSGLADAADDENEAEILSEAVAEIETARSLLSGLLEDLATGQVPGALQILAERLLRELIEMADPGLAPSIAMLEKVVSGEIADPEEIARIIQRLLVKSIVPEEFR